MFEQTWVDCNKDLSVCNPDLLFILKFHKTRIFRNNLNLELNLRGSQFTVSTFF